MFLILFRLFFLCVALLGDLFAVFQIAINGTTLQWVCLEPRTTVPCAHVRQLLPYHTDNERLNCKIPVG